MEIRFGEIMDVKESPLTSSPHSSRKASLRRSTSICRSESLGNARSARKSLILIWFGSKRREALRGIHSLSKLTDDFLITTFLSARSKAAGSFFFSFGANASIRKEILRGSSEAACETEASRPISSTYVIIIFLPAISDHKSRPAPSLSILTHFSPSGVSIPTSLNTNSLKGWIDTSPIFTLPPINPESSDCALFFIARCTGGNCRNT